MSHRKGFRHPYYVGMPMWEHIALLALAIASADGATGASSLQELVQRSVQNADADWAAAPQYAFTKRDVVIQLGEQITKTYQVTMVEASPYNKLIIINDRPFL